MTDKPFHHNTTAEAQYAALTVEQRDKLLRELFVILEYNEDGNPGVRWTIGDFDAMGDSFDRFGITFTPAKDDDDGQGTPFYPEDGDDEDGDGDGDPVLGFGDVFPDSGEPAVRPAYFNDHVDNYGGPCSWANAPLPSGIYRNERTCPDRCRASRVVDTREKQD